MKVSIIIPCYRQAQYLPTAIDSCLNQTHKDVEIIIVNDGSDDDTEQVASQYGDKVRYLHKKNGGLCAARNSGIAIATGEYLEFVDADDHIAPEQIERHLLAVDGRQDTVSVSGLRAYRDEDPSNYSDIIPDFEALLPDMLTQPDSAPHAWFFPATLIRSIGGYAENIAITGDWEILCRLGRLRPRLKCDPRIGGYYRLRRSSMSSNRLGMTEEVALQLIAMHDEFRDGPNKEWYCKELLGAEYRTYQRLLIRRSTNTDLVDQLGMRIDELWGFVGPPPGVSRKLLGLHRALGRRLAENVYARFARYRLRRAGRL